MIASRLSTFIFEVLSLHGICLCRQSVPLYEAEEGGVILVAAAKKSVQNSTTGQEETFQSSEVVYEPSALYR